ncbi:MAG: leucyl/phenylalanyl-tRNA--protein transferase [Anaerolineales bacterium]|nr:leucyl/phenylalanyl-tRNA--protein transferase [Anaerolineales bacterium]MCB8951768.1 leucyl/phenylalanyl-tRNA--protein transferase [Ardenticatenales bacterium]
MHLDPHQLLHAYTRGIFPMAHNGRVYWHDPHPRAILPLEALHVSRSLQRTIKKGTFTLSRNAAFAAVMRACARPAPGRESTWISEDFVTAYSELHRWGLAHSVEVWQEERLVGGLYGVAIHGLFAGESMFSAERDASKVALVHLVSHLRERGFTLFDVQFMTEHLRRLGAIEIPRRAYHQRLAAALKVPAYFQPLPLPPQGQPT